MPLKKGLLLMLNYAIKHVFIIYSCILADYILLDTT